MKFIAPTARQYCVLTIVALTTSAALAQNPGDPPRQITLDDAVRIALERNLQIEIAESNVKTSEARVSGAFGGFLPTVSLTGGYAKQLGESKTSVIGGVPIQVSRPDNTLTTTASTSLTLFDGFNRTASYAAARDNYDATVESLARTRQQIEFQTRQAYLLALRSQQVVEIRKSDLDVARDRLNRTRQLVEVGTAQITQVYSQEAEVANRELELEQAHTDVLVSRNNLALIINIDPAIEIQLSVQGLADGIGQAQMDSARTALGTFEQLLTRQRDARRDLEALRLGIEGARASLDASRAGYWPTVSSSLGYSWSKSAGQAASDNTVLSLDLRYTPFDGFRTSEQVELSRARLLQTEIDYQSRLADARSRLRNVLARLDGAERQIHAAAKALAAARQNRYAADERYRLGAGNESDFILANAQFLAAQINQVNAQFNYRLVLFELAYELGD